jgi:hypothetical protein
MGPLREDLLMGRLERRIDLDKLAQVLALQPEPHRHASNAKVQPRAHPPLPPKLPKPRPAAYARRLAEKETRRTERGRRWGWG